MFTSPLLKCKQCGGEYFSSYSGEFKSCGCGACSIDVTTSYMRTIGKEYERVGIATTENRKTTFNYYNEV